MKNGSAPIRRAAIVAPPSRWLSGEHHARRAAGAPGRACKDTGGATSEAVYCAFVQVSDPVSLTATPEMKMCRGLPSAVPRCSDEISRGPAFL